MDEDDEDRMRSGWASRAEDSTRFRSGRDGDDLLVSFECDECIFWKLYRGRPDLNRKEHVFAMACIRRINLDAFWSRAKSTVVANTAQARKMIASCKRMNLQGPFYPPGPLPLDDHCGYEVALLMVVASLEKGRYSNTHKQWDTIRKIRSTFSNQLRSAAISNFSTLSLADNQGSSYQRLAPDPCGSLWFQRFMTGCKKRMGQDWRPNRAMSVELMAALLELVEQKAIVTSDTATRHKWVMVGGYCCVCFVLSLRSSEGLLADLAGMIEHLQDGRPNLVIPLLGKFKGEDHSSQHLMPCVNVTDSGIQVKTWLYRVVAIHRAAGRTKGPMFLNNNGVQYSTSEMNVLFLECLTEIFERQPSMFGVDIKTVEDIVDKYHVFRSFRRGSESRAVAMKVSEADRYVVNRWRRKEVAGASRVSHPIGQHYVDISQVSPSFLRYTKAM